MTGNEPSVCSHCGETHSLALTCRKDRRVGRPPYTAALSVAQHEQFEKVRLEKVRIENEIENEKLKQIHKSKFDPVNKPEHYNSHPSGVECISITEHMNFCLGNALKYIWRADLKNGIEDLEKAVWYLKREIDRRSKKQSLQVSATTDIKS